MASGNIPLSGDVSQATGRISWSSSANQAGNYSLVNAEVYVILKGWGIQGTGSGNWYENDKVANTFRPKVNVAYGGTGTTSVYTKSGIKVAHNNDGNGSIKLGAEMSFTFAGIDYIKGSGTCTMDKIPRYAEAKLADSSYVDINSIKLSYTTDVTVDKSWYSINGGSYILLKEGDHVSHEFTINSLEPNTLYEIKVKVQRKDSGLSSESNVVAVRTDNKATITSAPNVTIGNNASVSFSNPSGAAVEMAIFDEAATKAIAAYRAVTTSPYTFQFTQAELDAIYALIPDATSVNLRYYIKTTQNGISYWDSVVKTFSVNQANNLPSAPTNITYADVNSKTLALTGNSSTVLLGYSDVKVNIGTASTAKNKATIKSYSITDGTTTKSISGTGSAPYSDTIEKVKRNSIDIFVFDSRNYSNKSSKTLSTLDYQPPKINANTNLKRIGGVGTSVTFVFSGYLWNKSFGKTANSIKYFRYKMLPTTSSNWDSVNWINIDSSKYTLAANGTISNVADAILPDFTIGVAYNVKIELTDQLDQTATVTLAVNSGEPIVAYNKPKKIVGIGKIPDKTLPKGSIDAAGTIKAPNFIAGIIQLTGHIESDVIPSTGKTQNIKQTSIGIIDRRDNNDLPSYYRNLGMGCYREFKLLSTIGLSGEAVSCGTLETEVPWGDVSGGRVLQCLKTSNGEYKRVGSADDSSWEKWTLVSSSETYYNSGNKPILILLPSGDVTKMISVRIYGNAYSNNLPIDTVIQGYHYTPQGNFINCKQHNNGGNLGNAAFTIVNGRSAIYVPTIGIYSSYIIEAYETISGRKIPITVQGTSYEYLSTLTLTYCTVTNSVATRVGTVVITSTNENPASYYGGTWELIDKEFKPWNGAVSWTAVNGTAEVMASRHGHTIFVRADITTTTALSDSTFTLGQMSVADIGVKAFTYQKYYTPFADGVNAVAYMTIKADGTIQSVDINQAAGNRTIDSGAFFVVNFIDVPNIDNMLDSACDKFYWKRTQ